MQTDWVALVVITVFILLFLLLGIAVLRRAQRRRAEQFKETREEEIEAKVEQERLLRESREAQAQAEAEAAPLSAEAREREARKDKKAKETAAPAAKKKETKKEEEEEVEGAGAQAAPAAAAPEAAEPAEAGVAAPPKPQDEAIARGLSRTSTSLRERLGAIFGRHPKLDPTTLDELEEALLTADVGVALTTRLMTGLRTELAQKKLLSRAEVQASLEAQLRTALAESEGLGDSLSLKGERPYVILFVGVNGVGKTTTIGKVAALAQARGLSTVLAAGDTFRAAAVEQLAVWSERTGSRLIRGESNADPASVVFNAIEHAHKQGVQLVLADTAGRLHTKTALMDEIKKVKRSAGKARAGAPDETWLVVDATTGQNALLQAREFHQALGLSGIILTKLDGTAKGGVVVAIADALHLPVRFIGVGEKAEDLRPFDPKSFVSALFAS